MRCEVDALKATSDSETHKTTKAEGADDLAAALAGLSVDGNVAGAGSNSSAGEVSSEVGVDFGGEWAQSEWEAVEMVTRSGHRPLDVGEKWSQMALSGTDMLVYGRHERGTFREVQTKSLEVRDRGGSASQATIMSERGA